MESGQKCISRVVRYSYRERANGTVVKGIFVCLLGFFVLLVIGLIPSTIFAFVRFLWL